MARALGIALAALVTAAALAVANIVLLGYVGARNNPVGKLSPVTAPVTTVPPTETNRDGHTPDD